MMNEETIEINNQLKESLFESANSLGRAIADSEPYQRYVKARENFRTDQSAKNASLEYNTVLRDYQMKANRGELIPEDEKILDESLKRAMENEVLKEFYESQKDLIDFYREINSYISDNINFNFASLAKPTSSCCG